MKTEENIVTFINNLEAENQDIECKLNSAREFYRKIFGQHIVRLQIHMVVKLF